jgi:REP element-mobilizing transposase RayT
MRNTKYNPNIHNRRSIRKKGYDYSQAGWYYVTICTYKKEYLFGEIVNERMALSTCGEIVKETLLDIPDRYKNVSLDEWVIMPNHLHIILVIRRKHVGVPLAGTPTSEAGTLTSETGTLTNKVGIPTNDIGIGARPIPTSKKTNNKLTLGMIVGAFKSLCVHNWLSYINYNNLKKRCLLWQSNFYEHIIRDEQYYLRIKEYITNNPKNWVKNEEYNYQYLNN